MEIPKKLKDEIEDYCKLNNIINIDEFMLKLLRRGFTVEKYGATPASNQVEKIVEKIVEVPINIVDEELIERHKLLTSENERLEKYVEELLGKIQKATIEETNKFKNHKKDLYGE
jgi:hypothetical protein